MNGADVLLYVDDGTGPVLVASQTGLTIDESNEDIDLSNKDQREYVGDYGRWSATMTLDALYVATDAGYQMLRDAERNATFVTVVVSEEGVLVESAQAIVTSLGREAPDQAPVTISCELKLSGAWVSGT